jgi:hypothetical protein
MKITQEVREFAASQAANGDIETRSLSQPQGEVAALNTEKGMEKMAELYRLAGDLYVPETK